MVKKEARKNNLEENSQTDIPVLFDEKVLTFPNLEELRLFSNELLKEIWHGQVPAEYFRKLKVLELRGFPKQSAILPSCLLRSLKNLEKLVLGDASFEKIFQYEELNGDTDEEKRSQMFHCLADLTLFKLPELIHLWEEGYQPGSMFQNLRTLRVMECENLKNLVPPSVSFQNLMTLEVSKCHGFIHLVTPSTAKSLTQLTRMRITDCKMIENIVACVGDEMKDGAVFTQLKYLNLKCLPNLECFCLGSYPLVFPSLEELIVIQCPNMKIFSEGELTAPKLQNVQVTEDKGEGHAEGSNNTTLQQLFKEQGVGLVFAVLCVITSQYACSGDSHKAGFSESEAGALLGCGNDLNDQQTRLSSCQCCSNSNEALAVIDAYPANPEISTSFGFWDISPCLLKFKYLQCLDSSLNSLIELDYFEPKIMLNVRDYSRNGRDSFEQMAELGQQDEVNNMNMGGSCMHKF
ncbi:cc-nbs-lrr resistance protein [Corchorus capsularis]|uniref:Cc-nbs-lrr resistance protein n=1 Tax=Corchorus capsularis TaxID=210143 RepID=A0A1R3HC20_COCAP|nr:cc-nbs-lrr resistance protein [Corchorus capsularis]